MTEDEIAKLAAALVPLQYGSPDGPAMRAWRRILDHHALQAGYGPTGLPPTGGFDPAVERWTRQFQADSHLARVDGLVGPITWGAALRRFPTEAASLATPPPTMRAGAAPKAAKRAEEGWPQQTRRRLDAAARIARFGEPGDESRLVDVLVPELAGIPGAPDGGMVRFHAEAAPRLRKLFEAWSREGLLRWVLSFDGGYQNRRVRPKAGTTPDAGAPPRDWSAHAHGIAFDINADWNLVGLPPAGLQERGSVLRLVATAEECGFWWGGFDAARPDGSHFELGGEPIAAPAAKAKPEPAAPGAKVGFVALTPPAIHLMAAGRPRATGVRLSAAKTSAGKASPARKAAMPKAGVAKAAAPKPAARKAAAPKAAAPRKAAPKASAKRAPSGGAATKTGARRGPAPKGKGRG